MTALFDVSDRTIAEPARARMLLELYLTKAENRGIRPVTIRGYRAAVEGFLSLSTTPPDPAGWTDAHLETWLAWHRHRGVSDNTRAYYQAQLWPFIGWLWERKVMARDPREDVGMVRRERRVQRVANQKVFESLLAVALNPTPKKSGKTTRLHPERDAAFVAFLAATGARGAELAGIRYEDIDWKAQHVLLRHTKGADERLVPFDSIAKLYGLEYVERRGQHDGPFFEGERGPLSADGLRQILERLSRAAGVRVSRHDFRRWRAERMLDAGMGPGSVMAVLGHRTITMTLHYARGNAQERALREYHERFR